MSNNPVVEHPHLAHPFSPDAEWTIAISRRFQGEKAVELYSTVMAPVLHAHGLTLECSYASDHFRSPDFWVDRVTTILAVTDIHVLLDMDRSGYVEFEFDRSQVQAFRGGAPALAATYGWVPHTASMLRPCRVLVTDSQAKIPTARTLRTTLLRITPTMSSTEISAELHQHLVKAKEARINWIRKSGKVFALSRRLYKFWPEHAKYFPEPRIVYTDAYRIATAFSEGATFATLWPVLQETKASPTPVENRVEERAVSISREVLDWIVKIKAGQIQLPVTLRGRYVYIRDCYRGWARRGFGEAAETSRSMQLGIAAISLFLAVSSRFRPTRGREVTPE